MAQVHISVAAIHNWFRRNGLHVCALISIFPYTLARAEKERRKEDEAALATLKQQLEVLQRSNLQQKREFEYAKARTSFSSSARKSLESGPQREDANAVNSDMTSPSRSVVSADDLGGSMAAPCKRQCRTSVCQLYLLSRIFWHQI